MDALPDVITSEAGELPTRLSCPDCSGVLTVHAEGARHHLVLTCRVGHQFSVTDLLIAKEERLEDRLWASLHGLQELCELLQDLGVFADRHGVGHLRTSFTERAARANADAGVIRMIIENNRALELDGSVTRIRGGRPL
jgi:two-component system, chemotaxis family, protein-glutamate methylesterase/glutaminase